MLSYNASPVSPGLVIGPCRLIMRRAAALQAVLQTPAAEQNLFDAARILAQGELLALMERADTDDAREIMMFQHAILDDSGFLNRVAEGIGQEKGALAAVQEALRHFSNAMKQLDDPYLSARSADIEDVGLRLCAILAGESYDPITLTEPAILAAENLYPSDLVGVDRHMLLGIVVAEGSPQSHAAIIARTLGIPALILAGQDFLQYADGAQMALDGTHGEFFIDPDPATLARFHHQQRLARRRTLYLESLRTTPCITKDGARINLLANCSNPEDIRIALAAGAEGVGLLRSEFLFIDDHLPDEAEQLDFYRRCIAAAGGMPLTIRTMDVGADKRIAGLSAENEDNPALGLRGVRLTLAYENLLITQFRALLQAAADGPLRIMIPMIATPQDFSRTRAIFDKVRASLAAEGKRFAGDVPLGVMIETPAAAILSDLLAREAAFFSIGTNDLTQYTLAADRTNPAVDEYYRPDSEAVQRMVHLTLYNAAAAGVPCSICGESAAVPELAIRYVQLGARSLSMAAPSIPEVKDALLDLDLTGLPFTPGLPPAVEALQRG